MSGDFFEAIEKFTAAANRLHEAAGRVRLALHPRCPVCGVNTIVFGCWCEESLGPEVKPACPKCADSGWPIDHAGRWRDPCDCAIGREQMMRARQGCPGDEVQP